MTRSSSAASTPARSSAARPGGGGEVGVSARPAPRWRRSRMPVRVYDPLVGLADPRGDLGVATTLLAAGCAPTDERRGAAQRRAAGGAARPARERVVRHRRASSCSAATRLDVRQRAPDEPGQDLAGAGLDEALDAPARAARAASRASGPGCVSASASRARTSSNGAAVIEQTTVTRGARNVDLRRARPPERRDAPAHRRRVEGARDRQRHRAQALRARPPRRRASSASARPDERRPGSGALSLATVRPARVGDRAARRRAPVAEQREHRAVAGALGRLLPSAGRAARRAAARRRRVERAGGDQRGELAERVAGDRRRRRRRRRAAARSRRRSRSRSPAARSACRRRRARRDRRRRPRSASARAGRDAPPRPRRACPAVWLPWPGKRSAVRCSSTPVGDRSYRPRRHYADPGLTDPPAGGSHGRGGGIAVTHATPRGVGSAEQPEPLRALHGLGAVARLRACGRARSCAP